MIVGHQAAGGLSRDDGKAAVDERAQLVAASAQNTPLPATIAGRCASFKIATTRSISARAGSATTAERGSRTGVSTAASSMRSWMTSMATSR